MAGAASGLYLVGNLIEGVAALTYPNYTPKPYQGYLLVVVVSSISASLNCFLAKSLPKIEGLVLVFMALAFVVVQIVLWALAPRLTAQEVFGTFTNDAGWSSLGLSMMSGNSLMANLLIGEWPRIMFVLVSDFCRLRQRCSHGRRDPSSLESHTKSHDYQLHYQWSPSPRHDHHLLLLPH